MPAIEIPGMPARLIVDEASEAWADRTVDRDWPGAPDGQVLMARETLTQLLMLAHHSGAHGIGLS